jgi:hypothetical protein
MPDTPFLSGLNFWVTDNPADGGGAPAAPPTAGGFAMSRDEMEAMLTKAEGTQRLIESQRDAVQRLGQVSPPAHDDASVRFTNAANDSGRYYIGHLMVQANYYRELINKIRQALGITVDNDQQAGKSVPNTPPSTGEAG